MTKTIDYKADALSMEELDMVAGGGIFDTVLKVLEATGEFLIFDFADAVETINEI